jgi:acetyl esterase/lipase
VLDLERAAAQRLGDRAVQDLLGAEPQQSPERYAVADPVRLVPPAVDVLCVHGTGDTTVPAEQSTRYAEAAAAQGVHVDVRLVPGDHMVLIDPAGEPWALSATGCRSARRRRAPADLRWTRDGDTPGRLVRADAAAADRRRPDHRRGGACAPGR